MQKQRLMLPKLKLTGLQLRRRRKLMQLQQLQRPKQLQQIWSNLQRKPKLQLHLRQEDDCKPSTQPEVTCPWQDAQRSSRRI